MRPAGVNRAKTKQKQNQHRNSVSSWSRTNARCVLCKDANSWFWEMLIAFCLPSFNLGYIARPSGRFRMFRRKVASNPIFSSTDTRLRNAAVGSDDIKSIVCCKKLKIFFFLWALSNPLAQTTIVCKLQLSEFGQYLQGLIDACLMPGFKFL